MPKIVIEVKEPLKDGDVLVYKNGYFIGANIISLLPELKALNKNIVALNARLSNDEKRTEELRESINEEFTKVYGALGELIKQ